MDTFTNHDSDIARKVKDEKMGHRVMVRHVYDKKKKEFVYGIYQKM